MKIILCTTPLRPVPPNYPPFGSMALIQHLQRHGYDPIFYDIDMFRPSFEKVIAYYREQKPDLIAISAVVSTAYAYTNKLCLALKEVLPHTPILVGGNLAASAELLHRRCKVDLCCISDGENVLLNVVKSIENCGGLPKSQVLEQIKGLTFINDAGHFVFTGYDVPIPASQFLDPDYSILERFSKIENYINDPFSRPDFARDPRSYEPHRKGQKKAILISSKGCVSRCTFCHRFDKGYRPIPAQAIIRQMKYLRDRYNVGFFDFGEENFGSDRQQIEELISLIKPMNVLFSVGGVRCRTVNPDFLKRLKESGCTGLYYGMESGSPDILQTMEKNTSLQDNLNAARWTHEAGLYTCYQLVLAMPGETYKTIDETIDFVKKITEYRKEAPHKLLSTNYIQALPGTPVYELARQKGLIGKTLEDEEAYMIKISDVDANDDTKFLNFTEEDYFSVQHWRHKLLLEAERHWYIVHNWNPPEFQLPDGAPPEERDYYTQGGYFNIKNIIHGPIFFRYFWFMRPFYYVGYVLAKGFKVFPFPVFLKLIGEYFVVRFKKRAVAIRDYRSVRRLVKDGMAPLKTISEQNMQVLRDAR